MTAEQIKEELAREVVNFKYTKKDGSERTASGTRNIDFIKSQDAEPSGNGVEKEGVITYYDIGKTGWRSFRVENFLGFI